MRNLLTCSCLVGVFACTGSLADAGMEFVAVESGAPVEGARYSVVIGDSGVAVSDGTEANRSLVLFRSEDGAVVFVDHRHRQFTVMTEDWLREANDKAQETFELMQERMKEQSASLSPQARKQQQQANTMMRLMPLMGGLYGDGAANKATYSRTYRRSEFNGLGCEQYDELIEGERLRVICLATPGEVGLGSSDAQVLDRFLKTLARLYIDGLVELGFELPLIAMYSEQFSGIPIAASSPDNSGFVLTGPASGISDESLFEIPSGYLEAQIPLFGF